jgi:hypothetical protein
MASARACTGRGDATAYPQLWRSACRSGRARPSVPWRCRITRHAIRRGGPIRNCAPACTGGRAGWSWTGGRRARHPGRTGHSSSRTSTKVPTTATRSRARPSASRSSASSRASSTSRASCSFRRSAGRKPDACRIRNCHGAGILGCTSRPPQPDVRLSRRRDHSATAGSTFEPDPPILPPPCDTLPTPHHMRASGCVSRRIDVESTEDTRSADEG